MGNQEEEGRTGEGRCCVQLGTSSTLKARGHLGKTCGGYSVLELRQ